MELLRIWMLRAAALLALLLWGAAAELWVRSYWTCDSWAAVDGEGLCAVQSYRGQIHYAGVSAGRLKSGEPVYPRPGWSHVPVAQARLWQEANGPRPATYTAAGFAFVTGASQYTIAAVPWWFVFAVLALACLGLIPPALRKRIVLPRVVCPACGYRTRGSLVACPKCGVPFTALPPPPPKIEPPPAPPRPSKKVESVVIKTVTPDQTRSRPTDDSGPAF